MAHAKQNALKCPLCGGELDDGLACRKCGSIVGGPSPKDEVGVQCPKCSADLSIDDVGCSKCGLKIWIDISSEESRLDSLKCPACGTAIGCNYDPRHMFWQGIDPIAAIRVLGDCIFHVHAKDTFVDPANTRVNGTLDAKNYGDVGARSWVFRACGYGHGDEFWKPFVSMLRLYGYDGVLSIEHEDSLMSLSEVFEKAVAYLKGVMLAQPVGKAWWF